MWVLAPSLPTLKYVEGGVTARHCLDITAKSISDVALYIWSYKMCEWCYRLAWEKGVIAIIITSLFPVN